LEYQDGVLEVKEALEGAEEEAPKEKEPEEEPKVSWLKIGLDALSLGMDLRKAYEQIQPKPKSRTTNLNILAAEIHLVNKEKGFWDKERNIGEMLMLVNSELGEAMEAHRKGKSADWIGYQEAIEGRALMSKEEAFEHCIKDSFEDEIADAVIRLLDLAAGLNINLDKHIEAKLAYNRSRDRFHGKEY
jgi:NTP pyrophosphatase (non-canonical NTP hydrolase)